MRREMMEKIGSSNPGIREEGWLMLRGERARSHWSIEPEEYDLLHDKAVHEPDPRVQRVAFGVLLGLAPYVFHEHKAVEDVENGKPASLGVWVWDSFRRPSAVLGLSDPNYRRRDEDALIVLARRLSEAQYPEVDFHKVPLDDPQMAQILAERAYENICIVGRLGLFGKEALTRWRNREARFDFPVQERPPMRKPGELDPDYHCVAEQTGRTQRRKPYKTKDDSGKRTDYGLVQRYTIFDGERHVVVVCCAGSTALGTLGAVRWAARSLMRPIHPNGDLITAPSGVSPDSHLEALLEVTAEITAHRWVPRIELLKLFVDRAQWSKSDRRWHTEPPGTITLLFNKIGPREPVGILFDGKPAPLQNSGLAFRLLARVCITSRTNSSRGIELSKLAKDEWVWGESHAGNEKRTRKHLTTLKSRYLGDGLVVDKKAALSPSVKVRIAIAESK
ncbi:MAG: hypothetical protein HY000_39760 [Planctomycetes bacterium]|nr:hypothetical protein [Planctomycetota bacterium]